MKKIAFLLSLFAVALFTSCDKRQSAIDDLESFSEELKENASEYTNEDWEEAGNQYQMLVEQVDQYEYTDEELKEIGKLKAKCFRSFAKSSAKALKSTMHNFKMQLDGASEEMEDALDEFKDIFDEFNE